MRRNTSLAIILIVFAFLATILIVKNVNTNTAEVSETDLNIIKETNSQLNSVSSTKCECVVNKATVDATGTATQTLFTDLTTDTNAIKANTITDKHKHLNIIPIVFVITPTYTRPTQKPDMTRLAQTLMHVNNLFWIVVEDSSHKTTFVSSLLNRTKLQYVHLLGPRPAQHQDKFSGRGVSNRLKGFEWLRNTYSNTDQKGVIYLADDDNSYDIRLFDEIRDTNKVSMFPVGLLPIFGLSAPIVSKNTGKIIGFHDPWIGGRKFALDMAGFAVNLQYFLSKPKATMPYKVGYEEDYFIRSLGIHLNEVEPKAHNCTEILVWHTKTNSGTAPIYENLAKENNFNDTYLTVLYDNVINIT